MSEGKIVRLTAVTASIGEPVEDVVSFLEERLGEARRGEILGVAVAWIDGA
jgi:hypothetical protein